MKTKLILLLFFVLWLSETQPTTIGGISIIGGSSSNPKYEKYWYAYDCCPKMDMPSNIKYLREKPGLLANYRFFQYRWCPCTHIVFGIDYSGSMGWYNQPTGLMPIAHAVLTWFATLLDNANNGSPFIYFFSYFYFNHVADIPEYLHIKPFTPLPPPPSPSGGTSFNNAIARGI